MEKRIPLAFLLSLLILLGWQYLFPSERPPRVEGTPTEALPGEREVSGARSPSGTAAGEAGMRETEPALPPLADEPEPWTAELDLGDPWERGNYRARFDNRGAVLTDLWIDGYYQRRGLSETAKADPLNWVQLLRGVESPAGIEGSLALVADAQWAARPLEVARWSHTELKDDAGHLLGVRFTHDGGSGVRFVKTIRVVPGRYELLVELAVEAIDPERVGERVALELTPSRGAPATSGDSFYVEPKARAAFRKGKELRLTSEARDFAGEERRGAFPPGPGELAFAGVDNKYFAVLLRPGDERARRSVQGAGWRRVFDPEWVRDNPGEEKKGFRRMATVVHLELVVPASTDAETDVAGYEYLVYAGPKDRGILAEHNPDHVVLINEDLGFFDGIASLLLRILGWFHRLVGNWGVSIILLTLAVRIVLFPFNRRSQTAMARHATKMKRVQPKLNEIKKRYEKDPKRLRQEQAKIMQEEGALPPLGGCLPMFVQIPIFFGLFSALRTSFELRQAPFVGWIQDLSAPDRFLAFGADLPFFGRYLNVLPPLMVVLWILQQRLTPKPATMDEQAARMQKMMMWMPIIFGFFLYNYAAGLSLYMITTSLFGILEMTAIRKIWPIDDTEQPRKKSGFMARLAKMQDDAQRMQQLQRAQNRSQTRAAKSSGRKAKR